MNKIKLLIIALCLTLPIPAVATGDWFTMAAGSGDGGAAVTTDFVFTVRTTGASETFMIPCQNVGVFNAVVDWGDGGATSTITTYNDADLAHIYASAGDYQIHISGTFPNIYFNSAGDKLKIRSVENLGVVGWTRFNNAFYGCTNLATFVGGNTDTAAVTNMQDMFRSCSGLTALDVSGFSTAIVTNMTYMFYGCSGLTALDVSGFSTAAVTNMSAMFYGCSGLTALDVSGFSTAAVTNMSSMFQNCSGLNVNVSGFSIAALTIATNMMSGSAFGNANYDALLVAWAAQEPNILNSVALHAGTAKYTEAAARAVLATTHSWTITDGGSL